MRRPLFIVGKRAGTLVCLNMVQRIRVIKSSLHMSQLRCPPVGLKPRSVTHGHSHTRRIKRLKAALEHQTTRTDRKTGTIEAKKAGYIGNSVSHVYPSWVIWYVLLRPPYIKDTLALLFDLRTFILMVGHQGYNVHWTLSRTS
eukprot:GHVU01224083.1.p1 GENE.GHVU01224083.1~~GHVU01224083.1.p1  ORF type:complete len:143 (-),score=1.55 GHVU01224083.1:25-453(-)